MRGISGYLRRHHLGLIAIFIALSGSAVAATVAKNSVTSKSIKNSSVKLKDLGPNSVDSSRVIEDSLTGADILESSLTGVTGPPGERGPQGETGPPGPSTGPAGGDLAGAYPNPTIAAGVVGPDELGTVPAARVGGPSEGPACMSDQSIASGSDLSVEFSISGPPLTGMFDEGNLHSGCGEPDRSRLTAPRSGLYHVSAGVLWPFNATGERLLAIRANGSLFLAQDEYDASSSEQTVQSVSTVARLNAGDFIEARVFQSSGAPLALGRLEPRNYIAMAWLAP